MTEAKAWEIVFAIRDYVEASHTTSARPRQPFLAAIVKALVAPDYEPPKATPVGNLNELLAHVDVPEPAPDRLCERLECEHPLSLHVPTETPRIERRCLAVGCGCSYLQARDLPQNTEPGRTSPETVPAIPQCSCGNPRCGKYPNGRI